MSDGCDLSFEGWLAACGAATATLAAAIETGLMIASGGDLARIMGFTVALLVPSLLAFVTISLLTAIPALLVIWLSERLRIHSVVFFGGAGAATGALCISLVAPSAVAGIVAGVTYWTVAGKGSVCGCHA